MLKEEVEIGNRIKECREKMNLTQEELGSPLGLNKSTIQRYESGKITRIKLPVLEAMADKLDVSPKYLALKTDDPTNRDGGITMHELFERDYTTAERMLIAKILINEYNKAADIITANQKIIDQNPNGENTVEKAAIELYTKRIETISKLHTDLI